MKLLVEYDGGAYVGWERQRNGLAVQQVLEEAFLTITREEVRVEGSGRTDAGVHALGQTASLDLGKDIDLRRLRKGLNAVLPRDVAVLDVVEVPADFHARKSARSKLYRYTILNSAVQRPMLRHFSYHEPRILDMEAMERAAALLPGTHDFRAFAREPWRHRSCQRTILAAGLRRDPPLLHFEIEGTGFLYNMVRILTGTLIEIGLGRRAVSSLPDLLAGAPRAEAGFTVPPHGLVLVLVRY